MTEKQKDDANTYIETVYSNYYRKPSIKNKEEDRIVTTEERLIEARKMCGALITEERRENKSHPPKSLKSKNGRNLKNRI